MGIKERKIREKQNRRSAILKAAKRIILQKGVEGMSMNKVADLTELNKATLYLYYDNKDDLIDAIVYEGLVLLEKEFLKGDQKSKSGLERLLDMVRTTFSFYRRHPIYFYALNHQERRISSARQQTLFSIKGDEVASRIFGKIAEYIDQGIGEGCIRKEIDSNDFPIQFYAQTYGIMHTVFSKKDIYKDVLDLDPEAIERSAIEFMEYCLRAG